MTDSTVFPYFTVGTVVHGYNRGSKELGCPTGISKSRKDHLYNCSLSQLISMKKLSTNYHRVFIKVFIMVGPNC